MAAFLGKAVIFDVAAEGHLLKCQGGDSNPYGFLHQILSLARLPIPPPWQQKTTQTSTNPSTFGSFKFLLTGRKRLTHARLTLWRSTSGTTPSPSSLQIGPNVRTRVTRQIGFLQPRCRR